MNTAPHAVIYQFFCYFSLFLIDFQWNTILKPYLMIFFPHKSLIWVIWGMPILKRPDHLSIALAGHRIQTVRAGTAGHLLGHWDVPLFEPIHGRAFGQDERRSGFVECESRLAVGPGDGSRPLPAQLQSEAAAFAQLSAHRLRFPAGSRQRGSARRPVPSDGRLLPLDRTPLSGTAIPAMEEEAGGGGWRRSQSRAPLVDFRRPLRHQRHQEEEQRQELELCQSTRRWYFALRAILPGISDASGRNDDRVETGTRAHRTGTGAGRTRDPAIPGHGTDCPVGDEEQRSLRWRSN